MSMIRIGDMWIGQGVGATLSVEWQNDDGTWEPHRVTQIGFNNTATLDNGQVIDASNIHRVRDQNARQASRRLR